MVSGWLELRPGRYSVRAAVKSTGFDLVRSVYLDTEVAAVSAAAALSGITLSAEPGVNAAVENLGYLLRVPTSRPAFAAGAKISGGTRVDRAADRGEDVELRTDIMAPDRSVTSKTYRLIASESSSEGFGDLQFEIPLRAGQLGTYEAAVTISGTKIVARVSLAVR